MADLLECLVQIRALSETAGRLSRLADSFPERAWGLRPTRSPELSAMEVLAGMIQVEETFSSSLRRALTEAAHRPAPSPSQEPPSAHRPETFPPVTAVEFFAAGRRHNLRLLAACSADDLSRRLPDPARGEVQVADLVALTLAHDTDSVGLILECLSSTPRPSPTHGEP